MDRESTTESSEDATILKAIEWAKQYHKEHPLQIGTAVAHPDDEYIYSLDDIIGGVAIVSCTADDTGVLIRKEFPVSEIFDVNLVRDKAIEFDAQSRTGNYKNN